MAAYKRKSWEEKFKVNRKPEVEVLDKDFADMHKGDRMLIATPEVVDAYLRNIPEGKQTDLKTIRNDLALQYNATVTCPVTTGIFLRIVAERAYEQWQKGKPLKEITPFWRAMNEKSTTAKKLSFGIDFLKEQRRKEGLKD
ncbi:MAG: hypothetical protein ICV79_10290 [Flavisolibacter sp.]|nr:hypothetical protein [Flavisolibacter sp.]